MASSSSPTRRHPRSGDRRAPPRAARGRPRPGRGVAHRRAASGARGRRATRCRCWPAGEWPRRVPSRPVRTSTESESGSPPSPPTCGWPARRQRSPIRSPPPPPGSSPIACAAASRSPSTGRSHRSILGPQAGRWRRDSRPPTPVCSASVPHPAARRGARGTDSGSWSARWDRRRPPGCSTTCRSRRSTQWRSTRWPSRFARSCGAGRQSRRWGARARATPPTIDRRSASRHAAGRRAGQRTDRASGPHPRRASQHGPLSAASRIGRVGIDPRRPDDALRLLREADDHRS